MSAAPNDLKLADLTLRKRKVKKRTKRSTLNCGGTQRTERTERTEGTERTDNENMRREDLRESTESSLQNISGKYLIFEIIKIFE